MPEKNDVDVQPPSIPSAIGVEEQVTIDDSAPPDGGYGWVCVFASFLVNSFTWGIAASYGVYLSYYVSHNTFPGASDIDYTFVGGSNFCAALIIAPLVNALLRRFTTNTVMYMGCVVWLIGWITSSFATTFWQLMLSQGICVGLGLGLVWVPSPGISAQWFSKRRSLANGITSAGSGIGGVIFSIATTPMIEQLSLAWSLRITGLTSFVMLVIASYLIRDRNKTIRPTVHPFDTKLLQNYRVFLFLAWSVFSILGYIVLLYSLGDYGRSLGLSQAQSGVIICVLNVGTAVGRPFIGIASDRFGRITVAGIITAFSGLASFAIWINATSYGVLLFFALIIGATLGVYWSTVASVSAEVVDLVDLPSLLSLAWICISMPALFSEAIALRLRRPESGRPYLYPQIYAGLCYFVAAGFLLELKRVKWGIWKREKHR